MLRHIALTGNVASGKSSVAELFRRWGATIIDADQLVRESQAPGSPVLDAIARRFGSSLIRADGTLDRSALRSIILADADARRDLEAIVHPEVDRRRRRLVAQARERGDPIVVSDIPLLFEAGDPAAFDAVVLVDAPTALRRARIIAARGLSGADADRLIAAQLPSAAKRQRSTYVIDNDSTAAELERRAGEVWRAISAA